MIEKANNVEVEEQETNNEKRLTLADITEMTVDEINENWEEIKKVLGGK